MKVFLRLLSFLRPFWWRIAIAILLGCIMVASNIALLGMAAYLIAAAALAPLLLSLSLPMYIVRFAGVSRAVSRYAERLIAHDATFRLLAEFRTRFYNRLEPLAPAQVQAYRSGDLLVRFVADVEELQHVFLRVVSPGMVAVVIIVFTFCLFTIFSPMLAWVALAFLIMAGIGVPLLTGMLAHNWGKRQLAARAELNAQLVDGIQGVQDLLACGAAFHHQRKISALDSTLGRVQGRMARITGLEQMLNDFLVHLALLTILTLAIPLVTTKAIDGVYLAFLSLVILASFEAVQPLAQAMQFLGHALTAGERLFRVTDATPQVIDCADPLSVPATPPVTGYTLEFDQVHFAYAPDEGEVMNGITFRVCPGQRIAIVGSSGAGKSTLVRLALRFWDPTSGTIRLNGKQLESYAVEDLRGLIGVVAQETHLFNDTVRNNLLLARPDANDSELAHVLEQAQLTEWVAQLPDGLETWVGEQGLRLSGGERQRLAIARALLKDAPLLILDEATANLDPLTERAVLDALDVLMQGRTTLVITHRLLAMERMDEIIVLDSGQVSERGTHDQLSKAHGFYQQMFDLQNSMLALP